MHAHHRGVTLIELLITIAILAITLAMGIPAFSESRTRAEVRSVTGELVSALRWARSEAIRTNQSAIVRFGAGATCADGTAAAWAVTMNAQVVNCAPGSEFSVRFRKIASLPAETVIFSSRGLVNTPVEPYQVTALVGSAFRKIMIELSGRINESG